MGFGVYIHFPYCRKRCPYCDFDIHVRRAIPHERYERGVADELSLRAAWFEGRTLASIYFGGGTPSLWEPACVARVIENLQARFPTKGPIEITLEANPDDLPPARLAGYRAAGVTRLSLGVQSLAPSQLALLGRDHGPAEVRRAVAGARAAGFDDLSLDLIYALPGQDVRALDRDLDALLALAPDHVSAYQLTVEERTPFGARARAGTLATPPPAQQADLAERLDERLRAAGFAHYEVSSWARPGRRAVHNSLYWSGGEWLGLGCAAHSFRRDGKGGERWSTVKNVDEWLRSLANSLNDRSIKNSTNVRSISADDPLIAHHERLDGDTLAREAMWLGLRLLEDGIPRARYAARFGVDPARRFAAEIDRLRRAELLAIDADRIRLTRRGALLADEVALSFL